jgi:integrase
MPTASHSGDDLTVGEYLDEWMDVQVSQLQPSTWSSYQATIRRYVDPGIGDEPLTALTVRDVNRLYARLHARGGVGGTPLAIRTVRYVHNVLHKAFEDAVVLDLLPANPSHRATLPKVDHTGDGATERQHTVWTAAQLRAFLAHVDGDRFHDLWLVAACTGVRRGELLGLRWEDVDLDAQTLRVRRSLSVVRGHARLKEPKTNRPRTLHLDAATVAALRRQGQRQEEALRDAGPCWSNRWGLVFTDRNGRHLSPDSVSQHFRRAVLNAPVPEKRLHDLRHLHATLMLQAGVPIKVVSERLGHASTQMTMDVYAHVLPAMDAEAVARFAEHVFGDPTT